jgi:predicted secreted protein
MDKIPLAETLSCLRQELRTAREEAREKGDLWFLVEEVEVELQVVVSKDGKGNVGFSVLGVEVGGGGGASKESVQRIRLKLGPRGADKSSKVYAGDDGEM